MSNATSQNTPRLVPSVSVSSVAATAQSAVVSSSCSAVSCHQPAGRQGCFTILEGDCLERLRALPEQSVHSVVTDPPYGIRFLGKAWDAGDIEDRVRSRRALDSRDRSVRAGTTGGYRAVAAEAGKYNRSADANREFQEWTAIWVAEALRVLKPGGYILSFASPRTYHRMAAGAEDAGAEVVGQLIWCFGSGMPKSRNVAKYDGLPEWAGYGTGLKPGHEPILVARKPLDGTYAENVRRHGTGLLNIDGCRIGEDADAGRWPSTLLLDDDAADELNLQKLDAARFFYVAKPGRFERDFGLDELPAGNPWARSGSANFGRMGSKSTDRKNIHPTVKPTGLMRQLCRLVTPPGGVVLDPFLGSGTTGCAVAEENRDAGRAPGWSFIGIEREPAYLPIARARVAARMRSADAVENAA